MERKSSKQYSVVFSVAGEKIKTRICLRGLVSSCRFSSAGSPANWSAQRSSSPINGSGPEAKPSRASAFWFFLSTTMVFAAVGTHFPKKNTRAHRNTVTCVARLTSFESSRSSSLELAAFGNCSDIKHGRASAFRYFLSTTIVFAAVRTRFAKKKTRVNVNPSAIQIA